MAEQNAPLWSLLLTEDEKAALTEAAEYVQKRYWGTGERALYSSLLAKLRDASEAEQKEQAS